MSSQIVPYCWLKQISTRPSESYSPFTSLIAPSTQLEARGGREGARERGSEGGREEGRERGRNGGRKGEKKEE